MQPNPFDGMDHDEVLRTLREQASGIEARAERLRAGLAAASATASSPDGAVTVTLSPTGALQDISFSAKAAGHKPEALGPLVMSAVRAAQRQVSAKLTDSLRDTAGESTMEFIRRFMPEAEPARPVRRDPGDEYGSVLRKRSGGGR
ncbi:MAG TPA: YbaB/EbfC family nucleoid-associated protein [Actinophytocola sp.]|uniref:YbaB/EbfC family nucleoid-associated protein n=1 Tax=Actinophytocola sp. TaxID=1872138 RepID=UPI002F92638A